MRTLVTAQEAQTKGEEQADQRELRELVEHHAWPEEHPWVAVAPAALVPHGGWRFFPVSKGELLVHRHPLGLRHRSRRRRLNRDRRHLHWRDCPLPLTITVVAPHYLRTAAPSTQRHEQREHPEPNRHIA